ERATSLLLVLPDARAVGPDQGFVTLHSDEPAAFLEGGVAHDGLGEFLRGDRDALPQRLLIDKLLLDQGVNRLPADPDQGALLRVLFTEELLVHSVEVARVRLEGRDRDGDSVDPGGPGLFLSAIRRPAAQGREGPPD